jgi:hypothetical protein
VENCERLATRFHSVSKTNENSDTNSFAGMSRYSMCINDLLDFVGYVLTLLNIADSHFTFHNFFILYAMHVPDSGGIVCFCLWILTGLTM